MYFLLFTIGVEDVAIKDIEKTAAYIGVPAKKSNSKDG